MAKASNGSSGKSSGQKVSKTAKAGLNPGTGVPLADSNLRKSVTEVPYTGQRGY